MNRVKEVLKEQGRSQTWLANELGIAKNHMNGICNNRYKLTEEVARKIKNLLGLATIDELYKEES